MQCLSDHLGERHGAKVCAYTHFLICRTICYQSGDLPYFCDMRDLRTKETEPSGRVSIRRAHNGENCHPLQSPIQNESVEP